MKLGVYRHFKGDLYRVVYVAKNAETLEHFAVYRRFGSSEMWVRPVTTFDEEVEPGIKRFVLLYE